MRVVLALALALLGTACGDRLVVDPLAALEKDPDAVLATAHPTYKATYETYMIWLTVRQGVSYPTTVRHVTTVVYAARPPDFRWDINYVDVSVPMNESVVLHEQRGEYCTNTAGPAACYVMEPELRDFWVEAFTDSPWESYRGILRKMDVQVLPRERIAGREGACFRWTTPGPLPTRTIQDSFEGCFTGDGVVLRAVMDLVDTRTEHRAVSIEDRVTDADLAIPFPVKAGPMPLRTGGTPPPPKVTPTPKH
jgi:hypothetical protein